jgi:hypothetical protein
MNGGVCQIAVDHGGQFPTGQSNLGFKQNVEIASTFELSKEG